MCGRYTLTAPTDALRLLFGIDTGPNWVPRWNISPTQDVLWIEWADAGGFRPQNGRWGLVPFFMKEAPSGPPMINARAETVREKPSFRAAFKRRRCLIVADGFYEWKKVGDTKDPYHIRFSGMHPFAMAGLFEHWTRPDGTDLASCTVITTTPNTLMAGIHDRMPVILAKEHYRLWLDPQAAESVLLPLLLPCPPEGMETIKVSKRVNNPRFDGPECLSS